MDVTSGMDATEARGDAWTLSLDLGSAHLAAVVTTGTGVPEPLEVDGASILPAGVWVDTHGRFVAGTAAMRRALLAPQRWQAAPVRLLGDGVSHTLDRAPFEPRDAVAEILSHVLFAATDRLGRSPARTVLVCPQPWPPARRAALADAAQRAGLDDVEIIGSADAGARYLFGAGLLQPGQTVAFLDAGAGSAGTAVVRWVGDGIDVLSSDWADGVGGDHADLAIYEQVVGSGLTRQDPGLQARLMQPEDARWRRAREALLREVRRAREELTRYGTVRLNTDAVPGASLDLTRHDLDLLIRPQVDRMVHQLQSTVAAAGVAAEDLDGVALLGGTAVTPLLARVIVAAIGQVPWLVPDPQLALAYGAATLVPARRPVPAGHGGLPWPAGETAAAGAAPDVMTGAVVIGPRSNDVSPMEGIPIPPAALHGGAEPEPLLPPEPIAIPDPAALRPPGPPRASFQPSGPPARPSLPPSGPPDPVFQPPWPAFELDVAAGPPSLRRTRYVAVLALTTALVLLGGVVAVIGLTGGDDTKGSAAPATSPARAPTTAPSPSVTALTRASTWAAWKEDADLAKAWPAVVPVTPGANGSAGQTCQIMPPESPYATHRILCTYLNGVRLTLFQYPSEASRGLREAQIATVSGVAKQERDMRNLDNQLVHGVLYEQPAQVWRWWLLDREARSAVFVTWPRHTADELADWWDTFAPFT